MSELVKYAVVEDNKHRSMPIGTPVHMHCIYALYNESAAEKTFSMGKINPADLGDQRCGICYDDWRPNPKLLEPIGHAVTCGCLNCGDKPARLPLEAVIAVGFGSAYVSKDGEYVLDGEERYHATEGKEHLKLVEAEVLAAADPDHDWRVVLNGPMGGQVYQRHGKDEWNLVIKLPGFA